MKQCRQVITNQAGFTLIEVLIAMAIFAIGITAVMSMQMSSMKGNTVANRLTASGAESSDFVEQVLATDLAQVAGIGVPGEITRVISPDDPADGMSTITVTIRKPGWGGVKPITISYVKSDI